MSEVPFFQQHLEEVFIVYGFSFLLLGVTLLLQPKEDRVLSFSPYLYLVGLFGLLHGAKELLDWWKLAHQPTALYVVWIDLSVLLASYLPLLEFGRRLLASQTFSYISSNRPIRIPVWSYGVLAVCILLFVGLAKSPTHGLDTGIRIFAGLTGSLLAGLGFLAYKRNEKSKLIKLGINYQLSMAGFAFVIYGLLTGLVISHDAKLGTVFITQEEFQEATGVPVQLLRAICAFAMAFSLAHLLRVINVQSRRNEQKALDDVMLLNLQLEQRVQERTQDLKDTVTQLENEVNNRAKAQSSLEAALAELRISEQTQRELREVALVEQSRLYALLSAMNIGILFEDRDGLIEYTNPSFRKMWSIPDGVTLEGEPTVQLLEHSGNRYSRPDHASRFVLRVFNTHEISDRFEVEMDDGRTLTQLSYPVMDNQERILGRLWVYEDITNERQTAQQLLYLAERDALTGLYNRHRFQEQLEQMIASARRVNSKFCLLYFDLDEFKYINDNFGHRSGDTVLVRAANELANMVRGDEMLARLGGDEFAILSMLKEGNNVNALPERVVKAISSIPFRFRGQNLRITVTVGVALFPEHGDNVEDLVAHADAAMYQAKHHGKNSFAIYDPGRDLSEAMVKRFTWNQRIAQALEQELLELHFQGIYATQDKTIRHVEALVRMRDVEQPDRLIMPSQFIVMAEKSNSIIGIDRWVIKTCIGLLAGKSDIPAIAVNLSGRSIDDPGLPNFIRNLLKKHDVSANRLILELTETTAVSDIQDAQRFIETMQHYGCTVCLDDFGSGFATFSYLKHLGVDILKIDGQFIRDLSNNYENQAFVKAMVDVATGLNKTCIAEFVEDAATLDMLCKLGVELAQGYYLDRPTADHPMLG